MTIEFKKFHGSFNDFIIIDNRSGIISRETAPILARMLCNPKVGIGGDGLILIERSDTCDFSWVFFNADGSEAEMCGNGARCAAKFSYLLGICGEKLKFETRAGVIEAEINNDKVTVTLPYLTTKVSIREVVISHNSHDYKTYFINTGVPHVLIYVDNLESINVKDLGRYIRFHDEFKPKGTNVNFVSIKDNKSLAIRTYERGVEDETLACGTGSVAASIVSCVLHNMTPPINVLTKGGEVLRVDFSYDKDSGMLSGVKLTGGASFVFDGRLSREFWEDLLAKI